MPDERDELLAEALQAIFGHLDRANPWRLDALCREPGYPVDAFFPERGASTNEACSVCARCAVRAECMQFATGELNGIWAGTSGRDRRKLRAAERVAA